MYPLSLSDTHTQTHTITQFKTECCIAVESGEELPENEIFAACVARRTEPEISPG